MVTQALVQILAFETPASGFLFFAYCASVNTVKSNNFPLLPLYLFDVLGDLGE
jgi:hypothetical protein